MTKPAIALAAIFILTAAASPPAVGPVPPQKPAAEAPPVPEVRPAPPAPAPEPAPTSGKNDESAAQPPESEAERAACVKALTETRAVFTVKEPKDDAGACGIVDPVELTEPVPGIRLDPPALLRCEAALATAEWVRDTVIPVTRRAFPDRKVSSLANASSYVCRNRNSAETGKVSEHAKGNALDIAVIAFAGGEKLVMKPRMEDGDMDGAFQRSLTAAACLYFTTVLSPGSDATHQDHLHLDVLERKNGYRYCR